MDLTAIPGMATKQTAIQNLIWWRNTNSAASASSYTNYLYNSALNSSNGPAGTMLSYTNTAGKVSNYLYVPPGDNFFLSRQDLIAYAQANSITNILPYVTTYSRDVNAPSFSPNLRSLTYTRYLQNLNVPSGAQ